MSKTEGLYTGEDGQARCWWPGGKDYYEHYHDHEWGRPLADDRRLFEKLCLEGFQAGLSWDTILRRRPGFRAAFDDFDCYKVAEYDSHRVDELVQDTGIIRHRKKIESTINNAQQTIRIINEFGSLATYLWQFEPPVSEHPTAFNYEQLSKLGITESSKRLSKDLKKRGFSFVGPTTMYAMMQSMGMVNDHIEGCHARKVCTDERAKFVKPVYGG